MTVRLLIDILSALTATVSFFLIAANLFVIVMTILHKRRLAMRVLFPFSRAVAMLRMSDSYRPSRPYRRW
ncbi:MULTISPECIES: hypothetical protein [unclassified Novosphingobium]|uniref:hypothetical protein n=1 Tax=unclassified Novosphingobium TaxID=2644732 RepID=UPI000D309617|nr:MULTISPECIES: hypothetical protein [unclassified Novosphingobium]